MFGNLFGKRGNAVVQKFSGNKDFLEAVCAGAALIASADGAIDDAEVIATSKAVRANKNLTAGFDGAEIEQCINKMLDRAGGGRAGRAGLWTEVTEVAKNPEMAEAVFLSALDVADSDGSIGDKEKTVLENLAQKLGVNMKKLMEV